MEEIRQRDFSVGFNALPFVLVRKDFCTDKQTLSSRTEWQNSLLCGSYTTVDNVRGSFAE